jgi:flavin-dependent dehydrogenase
MIDVAIIGGGISGLSMAIHCARAGLKTMILEKDEYPKHKVCGEYISNESKEYLIKLGVSIEDLNLPNISKFKLTTYHGNEYDCELSPGGF